MLEKLDPHSTTPDRSIQGRIHWARPVMILPLIAAILYLPALDWGLPAESSWSQDTIAGGRTLAALQNMPESFHGRYPPLHYLINDTLYKPFYAYWEGTGDWRVDPETGRTVLGGDVPAHFGTLIYISRWLSALMGLGAGLGIYFAIKALGKDEWTAAVGAAILMIGADFVYFSHLGNVDIPSMFWFAWSVFFYIRAIRSPSPIGCALLGLFAALAISTKSPLAGIYPGMAVVLVVVAVARMRSDGVSGEYPSLGKVISGWSLGFVVFVVAYSMASGLAWDWDGYTNRLDYWLGHTQNTIHAAQHRYPNQLSLGVASLWYAASAVGWPMLAVLVASVVYAIAHRPLRGKAIWLLVPAVSYYVIIIARVNFVYARFLLPIIALVAILGGIAVVDWLRCSRIPATFRAWLVCCVGLLSLGYAVSVDLEMLTDTRYQAEKWFVDNAGPQEAVGVFSKPQYLPRLGQEGFVTYQAPMLADVLRVPGPKYLILTSYNYEDFDAEQDSCRMALLRGEFAYEPVVHFSRRFLGTGSSWVSLAGWGTERTGKISPTLIVLERRGDTPPVHNP